MDFSLLKHHIECHSQVAEPRSVAAKIDCRTCERSEDLFATATITSGTRVIMIVARNRIKPIAMSVTWDRFDNEGLGGDCEGSARMQSVKTVKQRLNSECLERLRVWRVPPPHIWFSSRAFATSTLLIHASAQCQIQCFVEWLLSRVSCARDPLGLQALARDCNPPLGLPFPWVSPLQVLMPHAKGNGGRRATCSIVLGQAVYQWPSNDPIRTGQQMLINNGSSSYRCSPYGSLVAAAHLVLSHEVLEIRAVC